MELVEGDDLSERLARGPIPMDEALPIATQIAVALEAAHEKGIVHRDLKPANVMLTSSGLVKVLDFGLAKILDRGVPLTAPRSPSRRVPRTILGTPAYMAPEQAQGKAVDRRADIWAFGVVLYEMVTGTRLFRGASVQDTLAAVLTVEPEWRACPPTPNHSSGRVSSVIRSSDYATSATTGSFCPPRPPRPHVIRNGRAFRGV